MRFAVSFFLFIAILCAQHPAELAMVGAGATATGGAAFTQVGTPLNKNCTSPATSCAANYTPNATGNLVIVVGFVLNGTDSTITGVTDDGSGGSSTYTCRVNSKTLGNRISFVCETLAVKSGVSTITVAWTTSVVPCAYSIVEYKDSASTQTFDKATSSWNPNSAGTSSSNSLAPAAANELSVGIMIQNANQTNFFTGSNGYSCQNAPDTYDGDVVANCWLVVSGSPGSQAATATVAVSSDAQQVLYKP